MQKEAASKKCKIVAVDREAACYESIKAHNGMQCIGAYGFQFAVKAVCRDHRRPIWAKCLAETLNKREHPHLIIGAVECKW